MATLACNTPYSADAAPTSSSSTAHQRGPGPINTRSIRMIPYTPKVTIAALINADTGLGASG